MTRHLFVADPMANWRVDQDSTFGLMLQAQSRGDAISHCTTEGLLGRTDGARVRCSAIEVQAVQGQHVTFGAVEERPLGDFDLVWMRKDPPFDMNYIAATYVLDRAPKTTLVVNRPNSLRDWNEKAAVLRFPGWAPTCLLSRDIAALKRFAAEQGGSIVLKPLSFSGGNGIVAIHPGDLNTNALLEMSTRMGTEFVLAQRYLPAVVQGDKRVILVDGVARGVLLRVPPADDLRGNIHVGAQVSLSSLTERETALCAEVGAALREAGHVFVGIDLIGEHLTEINVTSPTGIREILAMGGPDLAAELIDAALAARSRQIDAGS
jgi:glutathione synthase